MWGRDCSGSVAIPTFAVLPHQSREAVSLHISLFLFSSQCLQQPLDQNSSAAASTPVSGWSLAMTPSRWFSFLKPEVSLCHVQEWFWMWNMLRTVMSSIAWQVLQGWFQCYQTPKGDQSSSADQSPSHKSIFQIYCWSFCAMSSSLCCHCFTLYLPFLFPVITGRSS